MPVQHKKELRLATIVFWVLLFYIIAALIWWYISLEHQNSLVYQLKRDQLSILDPSSDAYLAQLKSIKDLERRNSLKYTGEGITFLLLIIIGAIYIYRLVRRQFEWQRQQQNFVMAITHELKTPLAVTRINLETLQKRQLPEDKKKRFIQTSLDETNRLDTLINNILLSAQLDEQVYKGSREEVDLSGLCKDTIAEFRVRYPDRQVNEHITGDTEVFGDPLLLKLLVSNLLENANKYAPKKTAVTCSLKPEGNNVILQVADRGPGIVAEEKKKVFDKFYRVGNEQTRRTKGTGLGLFISRKIAQYHHADINVSDNEGGGAIFTVTFYS